MIPRKRPGQQGMLDTDGEFDRPQGLDVPLKSLDDRLGFRKPSQPELGSDFPGRSR